MTEQTKKNERRSFGSKLGKTVAVCTSVSIAILGVLFTIFCAHLYFTGGDHPYSRERVGAYLLPLAIPTLITVILAVWSFVLSYKAKYGADENSKLSESYRLYAYAPRFVGISLKEESKNAIETERRKRVIYNVVFFSVSTIFFIAAFVYVIFFAKFTVKHLNSDVMLAFTITLPLLALSVGVHVPRLYLVERSAQKERMALSFAAKNGAKPMGAVPPKEIKNEALVKRVCGFAVLGVAVAFVIIGILNGGMNDVLDKAVKICTECIGLG